MSKGIIAILGSGESGMGAAVLAQQLGYTVFVSDKGEISPEKQAELKQLEIEWEAGQHSMAILEEASLIVKSPGIPDHISLITDLKKKGKEIISEIEFASRHTDAKLIAITGSNGKTTTTQLVYDLMKDAGLNVGLAGNIGFSFARQVATHQFDYYVLELSSFQLDGCYDFKPHIAILTNITPDHLDRYDHSLDKYAASKFRIIQNQTEADYFIYGQDDEIIQSLLPKQTAKPQLLGFSLTDKNAAAHLEDTTLHIAANKTPFLSLDTEKMGLQGPHNHLNMMAAALVGNLLDIDYKSIDKSFCEFNPLPHRLEKIETVNEVLFVNDSKATNVDSTFWALQSFKRPIVWIVGGKDKGNDYSALFPLVEKNVKAIVAMGKDNTKIFEVFTDFNLPMVETFSMEEAVHAAIQLSDTGDCVLLSPCCASFDLFYNYIDRGDQFRELVLNLKTT